MKRKNNLARALKDIIAAYSDDEDEVDAVFITVLNRDDSIRLIPYDSINRTFNNSPKTVTYIGNGILEDSAMLGLASELAYLKIKDEELFKECYATLQIDTKFDDYNTLDEMIEEMVEGQNCFDLEENHSDIVQ